MHGTCRRAAVAISVLALIVYLPSLSAGFVFDDLMLVTKNEYAHSLRWVGRAFVTHLWDVGSLAVSDELGGAVDTTRRYYRPVVTLSFLFTWVAAGARAWIFHLTNAFLHAAASGLATRAAVRWTNSIYGGLLAGLVFALHPTRTENVVWISGRMDVLMLVFAFIALEAFERRKLVAALAFLVLAVLSKEPAVMTPVLLLATDRAPPIRKNLPLLIAAAMSVIYAVARNFFFRWDGTAARPFTPIGFFFTLGSYAHRALLPWPPVMYYDQIAYDEAGHRVYATAVLAFGVVAFIALVALLVHAWRRSKTAFWLVVAAGAFMGPLLRLFDNGMREAAQDRFLYAPLFFLIVAMIRLWRTPLRCLMKKRAFVLAGVGVALGAIGVIELRTLDYASEESFWRAEVAVNGTDPYALQMLARESARTGDLRGALGLYVRADEPAATRFQPNGGNQFIFAHFEEASLAAAILPDGEVQSLEALSDELWRAVEPVSQPRLGRVEGVPLGVPVNEATLAEHRARTTFHWEMALVASRTGDFVRAATAVERANEARTAAHPLNSVLVLARLGQFEEARALAQKIGKQVSFDVQTSGGEVERLLQRLDRAQDFAKARDAAEPDDVPAYEALRLAELGAYWAGFRALVQGGVESEKNAPVAVQLLVACRLDEAAMTLAERHFGLEAPDVVRKMQSSLPPALRELHAARMPLDAVIAASNKGR